MADSGAPMHLVRDRGAMNQRRHIRFIRLWLTVFAAGLVLAGLTAFPLEYESRLVTDWLHGSGAGFAHRFPGLATWLEDAHHGLADSYSHYPFLAYGTDWLAFGHLTIAVAFVGPIRDPVRNKWVVQFGMIACLLVIPMALISGPLREIPALWTPIDMSFAVVGIIPLVLAYRHIRALEQHVQHA